MKEFLPSLYRRKRPTKPKNSVEGSGVGEAGWNVAAWSSAASPRRRVTPTVYAVAFVLMIRVRLVSRSTRSKALPSPKLKPT